MSKQYIFPVLLGGTFFAVPYLALNIPLIPSMAAAVAAYGAGWLIFKDKKMDTNLTNMELNDKEALEHASELTEQLLVLSRKVEEEKLIKNIQEIGEISRKIIDTLKKKPEKLNQANNFLNYYLPVTIKILQRYDEIENQKLETLQTKKFMNSIQEMVEKIKVAFTTQLANMYQSDMIDTDAEIKVFESMLKADGFIEQEDFKTGKKEKD